MIKTLLFFTLAFFYLSKIMGQQLTLNSEERAYLYHVTVKSPVLKRNIGDLFHYKGDTVYFKFKDRKKLDSIIDYDSIEQKIIYEPSLLEINTYEFSSVENGIIAELASKLALQSLYRELKRKDEKKASGISNAVYLLFLEELTKKLPYKAIRTRNNKNEPIPKVIELLDPNLTFSERASQLKLMTGLSLAEQQQILDAIFEATQIYIQVKGEEYFNLLGGSGDFYSYLQAVGDGSSTSGLLGEREFIKTGRNKIGKPKGVGLFTYETTFITHKKNRQTLSPKQSVVTEYQTIPNNLTNLHLSMWGFNKRQQTTVVIRNKDTVYLLYASKVSKELSPDTTFGNGTTIHSLIYKLENESIPNLDEEINGKEGLKFKLEQAKKAREENLMKIKETEFALKSGSQKNHKLKKKNKVVTRQNGGERVAQTKGKIKTLQNRLAYLINRQQQIEKILATATEVLKTEEARIQRFRDRLAELKGYIDGKQMTYTKFGYVYTFEDGCTFNSFTQNFKISDSLKIKDFSIRVIAIGPDALSKRVDEIQLLSNVTTGIPEDLQIHPFTLSFQDNFKTDSYYTSPFYLKENERFELAKILYQILLDKKDLLFDLNGNGVGKLVNNQVVTSDQKEIDKYPGETKEEQQKAKNLSEFKNLRKTILELKETDEAVVLKIDSYTDPVKSNFSKKNIKVQPLKEKYKITENQLLSAFRTYSIFEKFYGEMLRSVYFSFDENERDKLLTILKKTFEKSSIQAGGKKIKLKEFESLLHTESTYYDIKMEQFKTEEEKIKALLEL